MCEPSVETKLAALIDRHLQDIAADLVNNNPGASAADAE